LNSTQPSNASQRNDANALNAIVVCCTSMSAKTDAAARVARGP